VIESLYIIVNILLFSLGCAGAAILILLHRSLELPITNAVLWIFIIFLANLFYNLIGYYLSSIDVYERIPVWIRSGLSILMVGALYWAIFRSLTALDGVTFFQAAIPTAAVFLLQLGRLILYLSAPPAVSETLYIPFICLISIYIFYVGLHFLNGINDDWNPAVKLLIKRLGIITVSFAPVSTILYIIFYVTGLREYIVISLDYFYLALWSITAVGIILQYLSQSRTIPKKEAVEESLIEQYRISPREREVLDLVRKGYTNKEIGEQLFISMTTARTHVSRLLEKTGTSNRVELVNTFS
jgi:DNA-binding CsgD family transcriptional regulator